MTGIELDPAITEAAIRGIAMSIGKTLTEAGMNFLGKTGGGLLDTAGNLTQQAKDLLIPISKEYIKTYTDRHGTLKVLGMGKPISLDSVYTKVNFHPEILYSFQSVEALENAFRQRERRKDEKQAGIDVANKESYLMILGGPGTGKTTFLRKIGLETLKGTKGDYQHSCIPVMLELRKFRSEKIDLEEKIAEEFKQCGLPEYQQCTTKFLEQGRLLILLDGLDEVPNERISEMTAGIRDLVDRYSKNRFITSCRIAAYRNYHNFQRFTDVAVADFDDEQIATFINKWFESHEQPEWGQQCWEKINGGDYQSAKELTKTPLLLTLICLLFQKTGQFRTKLATLYERALRILLEEWDASKEITRQQPYKGMDTKCKELMLAEIAYDNFVKDNLFFQGGEIAKQIEKILKEMLPDEKFIDGRAVLRAIEEQHGILVGRYEDIYSFSHLTLQEFLTAQQIVDNNIDIEKLVAEHLYDIRWREVFIMLAGLRRADELLLTMEKHIHTLVATPKLQQLLAWVERVADTSDGEIKAVGKRAIAIANANANALANANTFKYVLANAFANVFVKSDAFVKALANASNLSEVYALNKVYISKAYIDANAFFVLAIIIANASVIAINELIEYAQWSKEFQIYRDIDLTNLIATLEKMKAQIPDDSEPLDVRHAFAQRIVQIWMEAFHLTPETLNLSYDEIKELDNYLYANLLMVNCYKAVVRVSPETWNGIEARMLLPVKT